MCLYILFRRGLSAVDNWVGLLTFNYLNENLSFLEITIPYFIKRLKTSSWNSFEKIIKENILLNLHGFVLIDSIDMWTAAKIVLLIWRRSFEFLIKAKCLYYQVLAKINGKQVVSTISILLNHRLFKMNF